MQSNFETNFKITDVNYVNSNKYKRKQPTKTLKNYKFYLDIEKHSIFLEIQEKIESLGGTIEFFLSQTVTHFITDKFETPLLANYEKKEITVEDGTKKRSRADEMIHRARLNTSESTKNRLKIDNVKKPIIWKTDFALNFFNKLINEAKKYNTQQSKCIQSNPRILKGVFIKIEASQKYYRPCYKTFNSVKWPTINLDIDNNHESPLNIDKTKLNINCTNQQQDIKDGHINIPLVQQINNYTNNAGSVEQSTEPKCGFCEICKIEYDILMTHLNTKEHIYFARNNKNYSVLDSIIKTSASVDTFLKINNNNSEVFVDNMTKFQCSSDKVTNNITKKLKTSTDNKVDCMENKFFRQTRQSLIPKKSQATVHNNSLRCNEPIRKKRKSAKVIDYVEPKDEEEEEEEDDEEGAAGKPADISYFDITGGDKSNDIDDITKYKKDTPAAMSPADIKTMSLFYKVIDTEKHIQTKEVKEEPKDKTVEHKPALIVKFKKIRKSELSVLNGEAENFMFPKRNSTEKSCPSSNEKTSLKRSFSNLCENYPDAKLKKEQHSDTSQTDTIQKNIKKETLAKNTKQSKASGSSNTLSNTLNKIGDFNELNLDQRLDSNISMNRFSFERIPNDETWYNVFNRQDEGQEKIFEYYGNTAFRRLPYEMGPLPPLQTKTSCFSCTLQNNKNIISDFKASFEQNTLNHKQFLRKEAKTDETKKPGKSLNSNRFSKNSSVQNYEMPRKSPREHASTLAILSCFIQKSHEDVHSQSNTIEATANKEKYSNSQLSFLIESVKNLGSKKSGNVSKKKQKKKHINNGCVRSEPNYGEETTQSFDKNFTNSRELTNELDYFLLSSFNDKFEHIPYDHNTEHFSNNINLLELTREDDEQDFVTEKLLSHKYKAYSFFSPIKKRKNNKTGWPKKKKIVTRQQKINDKNSEIKTDTIPQNTILELLSPVPPIKTDDVDVDVDVDEKVIETYIKNFNETASTRIYNDANAYDIKKDLVESSESSMKIDTTSSSCETDQNCLFLEKCTTTDTEEYNHLHDHSSSSELNQKSSSSSNEPIHQTPEFVKKNLPVNNNNNNKNGTAKQPNIKPNYSPRKLRKPRGRWYRER